MTVLTTPRPGGVGLVTQTCPLPEGIVMTVLITLHPGEEEEVAVTCHHHEETEQAVLTCPLREDGKVLERNPLIYLQSGIGVGAVTRTYHHRGKGLQEGMDHLKSCSQVRNVLHNNVLGVDPWSDNVTNKIMLKEFWNYDWLTAIYLVVRIMDVNMDIPFTHKG